MQFSVLGPLAVHDSDAALPLGGPRQRSVLALLLLAAGRAVSTDRIITQIWGDNPPDGARDSLYTYVSNLRGVLGQDRIVRGDGGYRLDPQDDDTIDAIECEAGLERARRLVGSEPAHAIDLIESSLEGWRGRPYEGFEDLQPVNLEAERLKEMRLRAIEDRIEAELRTGGKPAVSDVELLSKEHPYRERLWELLARCLYRAGRQAEALRAFTRLRRILAEELGLEPSPSIVRLEEQILLQDPALEPDAAPPPTNLPTPVSSFVGRDRELAGLSDAIRQDRLVTIVAPGGAGKTRLAVEAGWKLRGGFSDGVWLVDLAQVSDPNAIADAVAAALHIVKSPGGDRFEDLVRRLRSHVALIVLDNCEHVAMAAGELAVRLLQAAPGLKILATSRQALGREGEIRFPLDGLNTASEGAPPEDAEQLFAVRAAAVRPEFTLEGANQQSVASICRHLDGLPLAIELSAARVDVLAPAEIDHHLGERFLLLADQRIERPAHQSLQASLDWSYDLLTPDEQAAFDSLSIFEGPFSAGAARAVMGTSSDVAAIELLRRLVGASLLQTVPGSPSRYRLLETMRLYARDHLTDRWDDVAGLHDGYYRDRCREMRPAVFGRGRVDAHAEIEPELADYDMAFDRLRDRGRVDDALEMAWALGHVWMFAGRLSEGDRRLQAVLDGPADLASRPRADALSVGSFLISWTQRYERAIDWSDEAIAIYRSIDDEQGLAYALARRGHFAFSVGDVPSALGLLQESLDVCTRIGYDDGTAWPLTLLAQARLWGGDESSEVQRMLEAGRERFIAIGEPLGQAHANMFLGNLGDGSVEHKLRYFSETMELAERPDADPLIRSAAFHNLAFGLWYAGELDRAKGLNRVAATAALETDSSVNSGMAFLQAAVFAGLRGEPERAAVLMGAGRAWFVMQMPPFYERQVRPGVEAATAALGDIRYRELYDLGAAMSVDEATAYLLAE